VDVVGMTKVRDCCTFLWMQDVNGPRRIVFARPYHCAACVGEMVRSAKLQRITVSGSIPMERVRAVLARQRPDLLDRWQRQLRAAAEAGFGLDGATAEVLPELLEAADRALERRFRTVPGGTTPILAESRRAAMQSSLLGDFLFDAVLESCPEINVAEQRLLSDALAQASVEVLVKGAISREQERRRRENLKLAKLAHDLRNSVTAAWLAMDLLQRKGALESKAGRALQRSLLRLRDGLENSLLDDVLSAGGLRLSRVRLAPVLDEAHAQLGALDKKRVLLERPARVLQIEADARLVRPAVRSLLRAAVQVARPGSTIRFSAAPERDRARVAVSVNDCRRLRGNRLPDLPSLSFARRAARAHGGSFSMKVSPGEGCEFRLDLPRVQPH
jgi:signal transduction histidine kinase